MRLRHLLVVAVVAAAAGPLTAAPAAHATHGTPPARTITYDVQQRGTVSTDLEQFARHAAATLADVRGWSLGGSLSYARVSSGGELTLWLAEASTLPSFSSVCSPSWSCRVGRDVIVNETRWRTATTSWTRSLDDYQHYVVNHELGHWLGLGHTSCPGGGRPAPVMHQQSKSLQGCAANAWPLDGERAAVAQRYGVTVRADLFTDIAGSVHADAVRVVADAGIVHGYADGSFRPDVAVVREQMASFLARAHDLRPTGESQFSDVADGEHADSVRAVADAGIALGYDDGTFRPERPVLREQMASFLARALELQTDDPSCAPADSTASVHAGAICAVLRAGVAQGRSYDSFDPVSAVTRGQTASFLARSAGLLPAVSG